MLKALPYAVAALVAIAALFQGAHALYNSVRQSGVSSCELAAKTKENESLDKLVAYVREQQIQQQQIEDAIRGDADNSKITSPVLIRTFNSVSKCGGKPSC